MSYTNEHRKRAAELKAVEASTLIATIPGLNNLLDDAGRQQIQKLLDAAVLNPFLKAEAVTADRNAIVAQSGDLVVRDPKKERDAARVAGKIIFIGKRDNTIRLDFSKMLAPDALTPRTNNPDEADYLAKVRNTLLAKGVWLRITQPWVDRDRPDLAKDPREWKLSFKLGPDGDAIATNDAQIDREELLGTTMLGAGYYDAVHTGPIKTKINRELSKFDRAYSDGWDEHMRLIRRYNDAPGPVGWISDKLGGASLPGTSIWDRPHDLRMKAATASNAGDVITAQVYLVIAALALQHSAEKLADYAEDSTNGAATAIKILNVAKTAGQVAQVGLLLTGIPLSVITARGASAATIAVAEREAVEAAAAKLAAEYAKRNGISQAELAAVRYVKLPGGGATRLGSGAGASGGRQSAGHGGDFSRW